MTQADLIAYRQGAAAQRRGDPRPDTNAVSAAYLLGWLAASFGWSL